MDTTGKSKSHTPDIEGYLSLKRNRIWVLRYVEIRAAKLSYYKTKGKFPNFERYIYIISIFARYFS